MPKPKPKANPVTLASRLAISLGSATLAAIVMAVVVVIQAWTGSRGNFQRSGNRVPFAQAWSDVPELAGLVFVVTFLVLAIIALVRNQNGAPLRKWR